MEPAKEVYTNERELPRGVKLIIYAEHQPEYTPLAVVRLPDGTLASRWLLDDEERRRVAETGEIFLIVSTFNQPLQPLQMMADPPAIATEEGTGRLFFYSPMCREKERARLKTEETASAEEKGSKEAEAASPGAMNWAMAERHLKRTIDIYSSLIGVPGTDTSLALAHVIMPLKRRFDAGERSRALYEEIISLE